MPPSWYSTRERELPPVSELEPPIATVPVSQEERSVVTDTVGRVLSRITSYNVCYTKLLRMKPPEATVASACSLPEPSRAL